MRTVITYYWAYQTGGTVDLPEKVTLCDACAAASERPLGGVSHGAHDGYCDACDDDEARYADEVS